jgi:hypothetical protein
MGCKLESSPSDKDAEFGSLKIEDGRWRMEDGCLMFEGSRNLASGTQMLHH